ncbi:MAG: family 78 glycoside hydrolase catalytic domain [Cyclobacteriaceae bacterium]
MAIGILFATHLFAQISVEKTWVNNSQNPIGIDESDPKFGWQMASNEKNTFQSAYEIQVSSSSTFDEIDIWQTGKVSSAQSIHIKYAGEPLQKGSKYYWRVRAWNQNDKSSDWSQTSTFQMGLLDPAEAFTAKWITPGFEEDTLNRPSPIFRKDFSLAQKDITKATAYITAHGVYEARLNGQRVGEYFMAPGWTSYNKRLQYQTYDVTEQVSKGKNAISVTLGNGWYRGYLAWRDAKNHYGNDIALLLQIEITYADGSQETIVTDKSWKTGLGPITFSEIYDGESYDSRLEAAFSKVGFDDQAWSNAREADFSKDVLVTTINEPIKQQEIVKPVNILTSKKGELIVDFGQNLVGLVQLMAEGASGAVIDVYHAEVLNEDGTFYTDNLRQAAQKASYILNGKGIQTLQPHFTFMGFRYAKIVGYPGELKPENINAIVLHSDVAPTGTFTTSDPLLNQLQSNIQWSQKGNFLDVPTDCPQRDERMGWTGDAQAFFRTAAFNMDVNNFFIKWMKDVAADQYENGSIPFVVPNILDYNNGSILKNNSAGSAGWADVATIIPWERYLLYGDKDILKNQYPTMKAWVEFMYNESNDHVWNTGFHFGDWLSYNPDDDRMGKAAVTDKYFLTQCFFAYSTQLLINAAEVLDLDEDIALYTDRLKNVKKAFLEEYVTPNGRIGPNTQTAYVLALQFDLLPEEQRQQAADRLVKNIRDYENHITTGFLGTPYICHVLSRFGYEEVAFDLLNQKTYPSWLYPVTMGATTIWERWDGIKPDGSFQTPRMNSFNHYAYGAVGDWMYRNIGGINLVKPAYKEFYIKPKPGNLSAANASLDTYYGQIKADWTRDETGFTLNANVPVNTTGIIFLPAGSVEEITLEGKKLSKFKNITASKDGDELVKIQLGSGTYSFNVPATR